MGARAEKVVRQKWCLLQARVELRHQIAHGTALTGRLRRCWSLSDDTAAAGHQAASDPVIAILLTLSRTTVVTRNADVATDANPTDGTLSTSRQQEGRSTPSRPIPTTTACSNARLSTRSLDDDVLGTNPKHDWKRFGDSLSTLGQISSAFVERRATEEGVDPVQSRSERGFAQAPHPSSRSLKEEQQRRAISTAKPCTEWDQPTRVP